MYYPGPLVDKHTGFLLFLLEIFLIPVYLGMLFHSILLFLYVLIGLVFAIFYFKLKIVIVGVSIVGIVVIAAFGWMFGEFFSLLFSSDAKIIGGICGAIFFGFLALGFYSRANEELFEWPILSSQDGKKITNNLTIKIDWIVFLVFILGVPLIYIGIYFTDTTYNNPIAGILGPPQYFQSNTVQLPDTCIGNCFIGQSATDGYYNTQKLTLNRVFYLKQPYFDPNNPDIDNWQNWDWILLDISLTNIDSENPIYYGTDELTDVINQQNMCLPGGLERGATELTDFDKYSPIKPGEVRRGNISCVINPNRIRPLKFEYGFDNWNYANSGRGKHAIFLIDKFTSLDYNSIKSSLNGNKPF